MSNFTLYCFIGFIGSTIINMLHKMQGNEGLRLVWLIGELIFLFGFLYNYIRERKA